MESVTRIQRLAALALLAAGCGTQRSAGPARSSAPAAPGAARPSATFTLLATGDVLPHNEIIRQSGGNAGGHGHDFRAMFAGPSGPGRRWRVRKAEFLPQLTDINDGFRVVNLNAALARQPGRSDYVRARDAIRTIVLSRGAGRSGLIMAN
ncbi:hypothetical protein ACIGW8_11680 [Streptomyces sioyaensis]|uniref:hypothetical protein n=1 Tax=Streptomyces sioyaensis TaxID=67364 RepID=UPI0037D2A1D9